MLKNRRKIITLISWTAVLLWMALIFNLSSQVAEQSNKISKDVTEMVVETVERVAPRGEFDVNSLNHIVRKNAHFFAYLVLGIFITNALRHSGVKGLRCYILALLISIIYAISDEVHQAFVPGRGPGIRDVFIDSAGAIVGIMVYRIIHNVLPIQKWIY